MFWNTKRKLCERTIEQEKIQEMFCQLCEQQLANHRDLMIIKANVNLLVKEAEDGSGIISQQRDLKKGGSRLN